MSRPLRIEYPGAWYHVMNRSRRGTDLYASPEDYTMFLELLMETSAMYNFRVAAYCLMPDNYHLLVQTPDGNLSRCMRHLNGIYTQRYNTAHNCEGTLFKGRYKSILVDADSYLLQLVRYIHRNPLRAGLCDTLDVYPWSSHPGYVSKAKKWNWLHKDFVLSMLAGGKSISRYKTFMGIDDSEEIAAFYSRGNLPSIIGSDHFIEALKDTFFGDKSNGEVPESKSLAPETSRIIQIVARKYKVAAGSLLKAKRGTENEPRNVAVYLARVLRAEPLMSIGAEFNLNRYSSVSSILARVNGKLASDRVFKKKVQGLKELVQKSQTKT